MITQGEKLQPKLSHALVQDLLSGQSHRRDDGGHFGRNVAELRVVLDFIAVMEPNFGSTMMAHSELRCGLHRWNSWGPGCAVLMGEAEWPTYRDTDYLETLKKASDRSGVF